MSTSIDGPYIFGCLEVKPIASLPRGARVRVRLRSDDFAYAYVRTKTGITCHLLAAQGETWTLGRAVRRNAVQLWLAFPQWDVIQPRHIRWLRLANAGPSDSGDYFRPDWKRLDFYPFKARFLAQHAQPDGLDLQVLRLTCHTCGGSGIWYSEYGWHRDWCNRCSGTGTYRHDAVILHRWKLCGSIFHTPGERKLWISKEEIAELTARHGRPAIRGLIQHAPVSRFRAQVAFASLLFGFEPHRFWPFVEEQAALWWQERLRALRYRLTAPINRFYRRAYRWLHESETRLATDTREWLGVAFDDIPF